MSPPSNEHFPAPLAPQDPDGPAITQSTIPPIVAECQELRRALDAIRREAEIAAHKAELTDYLLRAQLLALAAYAHAVLTANRLPRAPDLDEPAAPV